MPPSQNRTPLLKIRVRVALLRPIIEAASAASTSVQNYVAEIVESYGAQLRLAKIKRFPLPPKGPPAPVKIPGTNGHARPPASPEEIQKILHLREDLCDGERLTVAEIAARTGRSRSSVARILDQRKTEARP